MQVLVAEALGMCFGVRNALQRVAQIADPASATILGELVHNETVLVELRRRGFEIANEGDLGKIPDRPLVVITAHGTSDANRQRLQVADKRLLDTTCPLVAKVHRSAQQLQAAGYHVVVIGRPGHVEIAGIVGDLQSFDIVSSVEEVRHYPYEHLGVVCQTTAIPVEVEQIHRAIVQNNPAATIRFCDTVCHATKERQRALESLLDKVDAMIVVGGRKSNNTLQLARRCRERWVRVFQIEQADELCPEWLTDIAVVGLTAGASTPEAVIDEVHQALQALKMPARQSPCRPGAKPLERSVRCSTE